MSELKRMTVDDYYKTELVKLKQEPAPEKTAVILELLKTMDNDEICELMVEISAYINTIS